MENIVITTFSVESEAYQALAELKKAAVGNGYVISQAALVKKEDGRLISLDGFDTGMETRDDTRMGGLIGALFGIAGGPLGMILMGSYGALIGSAVDWGDAAQNAALMEHVLGCVTENSTVLIAVVQEDDATAYDRNFEKFHAESTRFNAAEVEAEIKEAERIQEEMAREAKKQLREAKKADRQQEIEARKAALKAHFDEVKAKFTK